jgi:hypothetical protein
VNCLFKENQVNFENEIGPNFKGGAVKFMSSQLNMVPAIEECFFVQNKVYGDKGQGGAVF